MESAGTLKPETGNRNKLVRLEFGAIPPQHEARVQTASIEALDRYCERILSAETIDELLAD